MRAPRPPIASAPLLGGVAALAVALAAGPAAAEAGPVRFAWVRARGADGCPSQQEIADQVAARLGGSPFAADAARSIEVIVTRDDHGFRAEIYERARGGATAGVRALTSEAATCAPIEAASVLAIALAIDPDAGTRPAPRPPAVAAPPSAPPPAPAVRPAPPPAPTPTPAPAPPVVPAPPGPPATALPRSRAMPLPAAAPPPSSAPALPPAPPPEDTLGASGMALRFGVGLGLLPKPAPGLGLAAQVGVASRVQVTAEALWLPEARTSDGRFGFGLAAFALGACVSAVRTGVVDLAGCGSFWAGALDAVVYALTPTAPGDWFWAAAALTPRLRVRLSSRIQAEGGVHVLVPITARPFEVAGSSSPVFQEAPVTGVPFVGLGAHFP